ncbi:ABC transporter ATP-binding protein [uncultured Desulfuromonas sp.]|uniref:energy-coupling factor ABC transporter ATP-binding protein n=1 Tax=uncultured Desulfuromonas sp. TaxID=181013 RepID=UPI002604E005|nr:ABC transporter ATP-binding protein [uncultured Desulfuromonas sp.]
MSSPTLAIEGLEYAYPDGTRALLGITCSIAAGESVAVVGANGAGKSTFLLHLNGSLISKTGAVRLAGNRVTAGNLRQVRQRVGVVFQDPDDQLFMPSVEEDVAFGPLNLGLPRQEVESRVREALGRVGVLHLRQRPPYHLSGGEKRAVAIAAVLAMEPEVLVLDEPAAGLDPQARRRLIELLRGFGHTRIIATHDLDLALDLCGRTLIMDGGRILADGPTADLLRDPELLAAGHLERPLRLQGCPVCGG